MIYDFLRARLSGLEGLEDKVFPVSANIDDVEGAFAVYTYRGTTPETDLSGAVHNYSERISVDFIGPLYDDLRRLYSEAEAALSVSNLDTGTGAYIFDSSCSNGEQESFDPDADLFRVPMQVSICWCPI